MGKFSSNGFWRWVGRKIIAAYPKQDQAIISDKSDNLRHLLRTEERNFIERVSGQFESTETWRFWLNLSLIPAGAFIAGVGRFLNDNNPDLWEPITFIGIVAAFLGGILVALVDRKRGKLIDSALKTLDVAFESINRAEILTGYLEDAKLLDDRRRFLMEVTLNAREVAERMPQSQDITPVLEAILDACLQQVEGAIGFEPGEFWAISIFQKVKSGQDNIMERVAARWADRSLEAVEEPRKWERGHGFTGVAWARKSDVIEEDVRPAEVAKHYPIPDAQKRDADNQRYISVAAIPILVGTQRKVWGVVTVTSDKAGRFRAAPDDIRSQYVDTVRVLAGIFALQVSYRDTAFMSDGE